MILMTDREKLIDLLCYIPGAEEIADFFLANGVTIPVRCKDCIHWHETEGVCLKIYSDGAVSPYA